MLPPDLTGYDKDVLLLPAIWDYDWILKNPANLSDKKNIVTSIKYFFKKERLAGSVQPGGEITNMVHDGLMLYTIGYNGVRLADSFTEPHKKFAMTFAGQSLVPKGYKLDFSQTRNSSDKIYSFLPAAMQGNPMIESHHFKLMEKEIERFRISEGESFNMGF